MNLTDFKVLTFDCYGTLIDWESGIAAALQPLAAKTRRAWMRDELLEAFARHEADQERATPDMIYSELLAVVHGRIAREWVVAASPEDNARFGRSVPDWPAFPDSAGALGYLKKHYALVILSNVDRVSFAASNAKLGVVFDHIFTAQDIGSYKPNPRNFGYMIDKLAQAGFARGDILHTAESLFHDHVPANRAGLASAWIYRRHAQQGFGATHPPESMPRIDFKFNSLAELAAAHRAALTA
jgi:2-haloacid dehalogenase